MNEHLTTISMYSSKIRYPGRHMRDADKNPECEIFEEDLFKEHENKKEFFSPGYPDKYPGKIKCVRKLEGKSLI